MIYKLNGFEPKNIVFDLGNVLLDLDFQRTIDAFNRDGFTDFAQVLETWPRNPVFTNFEIGKTSADEFRNEIRKLALKSMTDQQIDDAWNAMLVRFPDNRKAFLQQLSSKYNLFLFSNINEIHLDGYLHCLKRDLGLDNFSGIFTKEYYSHLEGTRKPELTGFQRIIEQNKLIPAETLFVDDLQKNVEAAVNVGMMGHWLEPDEELTKILEHLT